MEKKCLLVSAIMDPKAHVEDASSQTGQSMNPGTCFFEGEKKTNESKRQKSFSGPTLLIPQLYSAKKVPQATISTSKARH